MITPTRIREIFAEELRKAGEDRRAERVLDGSEVGSVYSAALKAMQRIASDENGDEYPDPDYGERP